MFVGNRLRRFTEQVIAVNGAQKIHFFPSETFVQSAKTSFLFSIFLPSSSNDPSCVDFLRSNQGDRIGRIYADWPVAYFGQFF
jgi:hypothetical protein